MNPRHAFRDLRWWYRTTFKNWHEGPEYASCPDCGGKVYHNWRQVVEYRCRDCTWQKLGTTKFEFYREQREEETTPWDAYKTYIEAFDELSPSGKEDAEAKVEWLKDGGAEKIIERVDDELGPDGLEALIEAAERAENSPK